MDRFHRRGAHGFLFADAAALTHDPALGEAARHVHQHFAQALAELIERGQQAGDIRDGIAPHTAAWGLVSLLAGRSFHAAVVPDPATVEAELTESALRSLLPETYHGPEYTSEDEKAPLAGPIPRARGLTLGALPAECSVWPTASAPPRSGATPTARSATRRFGGFKNSGIGRENGNGANWPTRRTRASGSTPAPPPATPSCSTEEPHARRPGHRRPGRVVFQGLKVRLVSLSFASLLTGLGQSLGTPWGLLRHCWVVFQLLINVVATVLLMTRYGWRRQHESRARQRIAVQESPAAVRRLAARRQPHGRASELSPSWWTSRRTV